MAVEFLPTFNDVSAAYAVANRAQEYEGREWMESFEEAMRAFGYVQKGGPCSCEFGY